MNPGQPLSAYSPRTRGGHLIGAITSQKRTAWPGSVRLTLFLSEVSPGLARKNEGT